LDAVYEEAGAESQWWDDSVQDVATYMDMAATSEQELRAILQLSQQGGLPDQQQQRCRELLSELLCMRAYMLVLLCPAAALADMREANQLNPAGQHENCLRMRIEARAQLQLGRFAQAAATLQAMLHLPAAGRQWVQRQQQFVINAQQLVGTIRNMLHGTGDASTGQAELEQLQALRLHCKHSDELLLLEACLHCWRGQPQALQQALASQFTLPDLLRGRLGAAWAQAGSIVGLSATTWAAWLGGMASTGTLVWEAPFSSSSFQSFSFACDLLRHQATPTAAAAVAAALAAADPQLAEVLGSWYPSEANLQEAQETVAKMVEDQQLVHAAIEALPFDKSITTPLQLDTLLKVIRRELHPALAAVAHAAYAEACDARRQRFSALTAYMDAGVLSEAHRPADAAHAYVR
jgi:hypothetical protein